MCLNCSLNKGVYMNFDIDTMKSMIKESREQNKPIIFKNIINNPFSWDHFVQILNYKFHSLQQQHIEQEPGKRFITNKNRIVDILIYNKLDMHVFNILGYKPELYDDILNLLEQVFEYERIHFGSKALINFIGNEADYGIHYDYHDVILWNCIGSVSWNIYEDENNKDKYETYKIDAGDILFAPKGVIHQAVVTEPRASFVFGFNYDEE